MDEKIKIENFFFNFKSECCAEVTKEVEWFDQIRKEVIVAPKQILQHFNLNARA